MTENGYFSIIFSAMKNQRVIRRKCTYHGAVSLISRQSLEKTKKTRRGKMEEKEGDEVVNPAAVCLHLSAH